MKKIFKKFIKNKVFYILIFLTILMFPSAIYLTSEKDRYAIVTALGIDIIDNKINISALIITPKTESQMLNNTQLMSESGNTVSQAVEKLSLIAGKRIGLGHCETIVLSNEILNNDITKVLDYFMRTNNLTANASLITTNKKSKDLLEASISSGLKLNLNLKDIVEFNTLNLFNSNTTIEEFFTQYYSKSPVSFLPIIEVLESSNSESNSSSDSGSSSSSSGGSSSSSNSSSSNSSNSNSSSSNSSGSSSSSSEDSSSQGSNNKEIKNNGNTIVLVKGKKIRELDRDEIEIYNLLLNDKDNQIILIENYSNDNLENATLTIEISNKKISSIVDIQNEKVVLNNKIDISVKIAEYNSNQYPLEILDETESFIDENIKNKLKDKINNSIIKLNNNIINTKTDVFHLSDKLYKFNNTKWKEYISTLKSEDDFLNNLIIITDIQIKGRY